MYGRAYDAGMQGRCGVQYRQGRRGVAFCRACGFELHFTRVAEVAAVAHVRAHTHTHARTHANTSRRPELRRVK